MNQMFNSKQQVWVVILALLLLSIHGLAAQVTTASLEGTISDETQAVLPGVEITLTNLGTGATRTTISGDGGGYLLSDLSPADYELEAQLPGFQTFVQSGINLTIGRSASLNITLSIGAVTERVVVTGDAPLVDTLTSSIRGLVDARTVSDLPLNGRSFDQLATLQSGVVAYYGAGENTGTGQSGGGQRMSIGGARPTSNNFLMDGININAASNSTPGSAAGGVNLGVEAIQEFEVLTSSFDATYGRSSGGVISVVTKSGSNQLHGSLFAYHRNAALDAKNWFDKTDLDIPAFKRNQFGFSLGGPIVKDKIFLFGTYEGYRERVAESNTADVPTADGRLGIGVGPGGSNVDVNPGVVRYISLFPLPNDPANMDFGDGTGRFLSGPVRSLYDDYFVLRYDQIIGDSDSMFVRYTCACNGLRDSPSDIGIFNSSTVSRRQYVTIEEKHIFSPAVLNTMRIGFNRSFSDRDDELADSTLELVPGTGRFDLNFESQVTGSSSFLESMGPGGISFQALNSLQFGDDFHYTKGRHSVRVGVTAEWIAHNHTNAAFFGGDYAFDNFNAFLQGISREFSAYAIDAQVFRGMRTTILSLYLQDDFKVRPNFTLNLGLRFENQGDVTEVNGLQSRLLNVLDPVACKGCPYYDKPGALIEPRVGLAWDLFGDGKTSLRAGAGLFNDLLIGTYWINMGVNEPFFSKLSTISDPDPAVFPDAFGLLGAGAGASSIIRGAENASLPNRTQWNVTLQQELFPDTVLTLAYTGAVGRHAVRTAEANTSLPTGVINGLNVWCTDPGAGCVSDIEPDLPRRNDQFGFLLQLNTDANSVYHSAQASIRKRYSRGLQFLSSYTWGHSIDDGSQQWGSEGRNNPQNTFDNYDHTFDRGKTSATLSHLAASTNSPLARASSMEPTGTV
jgi:hypothetical protein